MQRLKKPGNHGAAVAAIGETDPTPLADVRLSTQNNLKKKKSKKKGGPSGRTMFFKKNTENQDKGMLQDSQAPSSHHLKNTPGSLFLRKKRRVTGGKKGEAPVLFHIDSDNNELQGS
jgi:hypothetical protein